MRDQELRNLLNDELHGRPGIPVTAPSRVTHLAFTVGDGDPLPHVKMLCDTLGVKAPADGSPHHTAEIAGGQFKYERHGEFYRVSVVAEGGPEKGEALVILPTSRSPGRPSTQPTGRMTSASPFSGPPSATSLTR